MEYNKHYQTQNVSDTQRLTNTQSKPTKDTSNTKTMETQQKLTQKNYQTLICSVEDFLAKHSQSLENGEVSKIPEEHSFLILQELLKLKDLKLFSLKMSRGYSITTKGRLSESSFKRFQNWGMMFNGWFLTADIIHNKEDKEFTSLEFLEPIMEHEASQNWDLQGNWIRGRLKALPTISTKPIGRGECVIIEAKGKRRWLTMIECERLQGFPDDWTKGVSNTQRYKQCGNAVTTKVIKSIVEKLIGGKFTKVRRHFD